MPEDSDHEQPTSRSGGTEMPGPVRACRCCGFLTLYDVHPGSFEICPICFWEDDEVQGRDPDFSGGANRVSLRQAQRNFLTFGACEQEAVSQVRRPASTDQRDPYWLPLRGMLALLNSGDADATGAAASSGSKPRGQIIAEVGGLGPVDRLNLAVAIYGEELDPDAITGILHVRPTSSQRRGDRRRPTSAPLRLGAWFLEDSCYRPSNPDAVLLELLGQLPDDQESWDNLAATYDVQLRAGFHFHGWNRGFDFPPEAVSKLARMHARIVLDLYAYNDEDL